MSDSVTNIVVAGLGGQGAITASDIIAEAAFLAGFDVKKSEIHGMSQRGGSVTSDVRFGSRVYSPMVPEGEADYLVVLDPSQTALTRHVLRPSGRLITPEVFFDEDKGVSDIDDLDADDAIPVTKRTLNTALLGVVSTYLDIPPAAWVDAIRASVAERYLDGNVKAFYYGRGSHGGL